MSDSNGNAIVAIGLHGLMNHYNISTTPTPILLQPFPSCRVWVTLLNANGTQLLNALDLTFFGTTGILLNHYSQSGNLRGTLPISVPLLDPLSSTNISIDYNNSNFNLACDSSITILARAFIIPASANFPNIYSANGLRENIVGSGITFQSNSVFTNGCTISGPLLLKNATMSVDSTVLSQTFSLAGLSPSWMSNLNGTIKKMGNTIYISFSVQINSSIAIAVGDFAFFLVSDSTCLPTNYTSTSACLNDTLGTNPDHCTVYHTGSANTPFNLRTNSQIPIATTKIINGSVCYVL